MFQIAIIVFREILEISLIVGILAAATKGVRGRSKWILLGLICGITGSVIIAFFTDQISDFFNGSGQEAFNAAVLLVCATMISYTVIWMQKYAKSITAHLRYIGKTIVEKKRSLIALVPIVAFAVLREGSEIVLFGYGAFVSGQNIKDLTIGSLAGLAVGITVGFSLYLGMIRAFGKYFFSITSWMLIFLSAGMVAGAMGYLSSGGFLPELEYPLWDSSGFVEEKSITGRILNVLIGYTAKPSGIQVLGYSITLIILFLGLNYDRFFRGKEKNHAA